MDYSKDLVEAPIPVLAPHTLVFLSGHPISFVIPYLNTEGSWFIALDSLPTASAEFSVVQKLVQEAGDIRLLTNADTTPVDIMEINGRLAPFNLVYSESTCAPIYSAVQKRIRLCAVGRHPSVK